jgi:hypothetical protein
MIASRPSFANREPDWVFRSQADHCSGPRVPLEMTDAAELAAPRRPNCSVGPLQTEPTGEHAFVDPKGVRRAQL